MKTLEILKNYLKLYSIQRNEVLFTCLKKNIPLTNENIKEVREILNQTKKLQTKG